MIFVNLYLASVVAIPFVLWVTGCRIRALFEFPQDVRIRFVEVLFGPIALMSAAIGQPEWAIVALLGVLWLRTGMAIHVRFASSSNLPGIDASETEALANTTVAEWLKRNEQALYSWGFALTLPSVVALFFLSGKHVWGWIWLALCALMFAVWGLGRVFGPSRCREICANLTASERQRAGEMAMAYGYKMGLRSGLIGAPAIFMLGFLFWNDWFWLVVSILVLISALELIELPEGLKQRQAFKDFLFSTEYAKQKGYSPMQS